ncbi:type 2 isopentenyl-diphosphate Delta-isomerase [Listeria monocytogenes]|uniref:type 2 isopentenyl-diphosphate Delta-isomerase n=1 Tax=Listeria monocytogenes TaxID=1639 RepID=UPI0010B0EEBF|nr:type 2 isopentenyl-diphosphate Delta-isomerase [Listeria monocytogenes]EAC8325638.1 type 2 isopentenyl-diphosphate Delta-isomerase [Listeria monocytogenes]EAC8329297.1 type 2 isopentenyl-diphosphate Delta-isomerase [Listeria monocytogenes]EAC8634779.1 type 2 isopentenyl-diphosphate Delta-isomerase [Listeria monocytogenes]EAG0757763.1 type 2 isopentenyl-diphosphate Delta-isomerase [Listeria monocytogenes]EAG3840600.1 type 2 isopentenyl-diphosphate Delta-isomerase [Listeria monocytogenes]
MQKNDDLLRERRKDEHVALGVKQNEQLAPSSLEDIQLIGTSIPRYNVKDIDLTTTIVGTNVPFPFYINAMTGGSRHTKKINAELAEIAREVAIPMAVGSQSAALKNSSLIDTYKIVREINPNGMILANISPEVALQEGLRAIEMLEADALQIHINPAQELVMQEGDRSFSHWLTRIEEYVKLSPVPVVVKEVGFGMTRETVATLASVGVQSVDLAGKGGTNFAQIENDRRRDQAYDFLLDWGISTGQALIDMQHQDAPKIAYLASGGIRNPLDIVKALALGADSVGMAGQIIYSLKKEGLTKTIEKLELWKEQLRGLFVLADAKNITELKTTPLIISGELAQWGTLREIDLVKLANRK